MKLITLLACICITHLAIAQKSMQAQLISAPITIDGQVSEANWQSHLVRGEFIQTTPDNGAASLRRSDIALLYDQRYLYVAAIFYVEAATEINSQLTARDDTGNSDFFGLQIDPFGQAREGYDFTVSAAGVQSDLKLSAAGAYANFNVVWESEVEIYDDRWEVEIKIPFNSIRFPKEDMSNFRINFQRFSSALNEESYWNPIRLDVDGFLNQFGKLEGLGKIDPPLNLSLLPFVSTVFEKGPGDTGQTSFNAGLDLKYVYDNAYTLDLSVIPDFSQAQSDDQVFNLSPFEVRFNENRQFFVEGTELFDKGNYLFTRRIGGRPINSRFEIGENEEIISNPVSSNILNLMKLTGKSDAGFSIGVLNGVTAFAKAEVKNTETGETREVETNPLSNYNALVFDQQLKNNSSVTLLNNSVIRSGSTYDSNFTALLYRWYNAKRTYSGNFRTALSQKYGLAEGNEFGSEYFGYVSKVSGTWTGGVSFNLKDETYDNNDFGFLRRNNQMSVRASLNYNKTNPKKWFARYQIGFDHQQQYYYSLMEQEQTYYKLIASGTTKKNQNLFGVFTYVAARQDFFEAREKDRVFKKPAFTETVLEYQTNRNKSISWAGYFVAVDYLDDAIFTEEYVMGYGLRGRLGQHFFLELEQDYATNPNEVGFITRQDDNIILGKRNIKQLTNALQLNYAVNAKLNMNLRVRHYWIQVDYDQQFSLRENGQLATNDLAINPNDFDSNFNAFNIDLIARWQFAPASELSLGYKLGTTYFTQDVGSDYFSNFDNTLNTEGNHTLSVKMTYFLDWNSLSSKRRKRNAI